jgi:hypothetical protein
LQFFAVDYSVVVSYLNPGDDRAPRRVSDAVPDHEWLRSVGYNEVFRETGARFQLSVVVQLTATQGTGWVFTRTLSDFDDDDVATAAVLLPQAMAGRACLAAPLQVRHRVVVRRRRDAHSRRAAHAQGADHAGCRRIRFYRLHDRAGPGISEGTVNKHLEHAYAKLGAHDRLSTLNASRTLQQDVAVWASPPQARSAASHTLPCMIAGAGWVPARGTRSVPFQRAHE